MTATNARLEVQHLNRLTPDQLEAWERDGYLIVSGLFEPDRVESIRRRFDDLGHSAQPVERYWKPEPTSDDPLERFPRVMHPHRFDELSKQSMLHPAVGEALHDLFGEPAVACQSMFYFKPPGSAGQSLHQDNFYLAVQPGTCIAAWTAIDAAHPGNGGMYVVPGSHRLDVICPDAETFNVKRGSNLVDPPRGMKAVPAEMQPGDTLFFNGSLIHGSGRNRSDTEWRRSFIGHYMPASSRCVSRAYFPILDFTGREIPYDAADNGGPCGEALQGLRNTYGTDAVIH